MVSSGACPAPGTRVNAMCSTIPCSRYTLNESSPSTRVARTISLAALVIVAIALPDPRSVHGLCLYAWLLAATASGQTRGSLLAHPATRVLGELSFGVYLLHGIVLHMAFTLVPGAGQAPLLTIPAVALATTLISAALALTVERPAIRLGRWMTRS